MDMQPLTRKQQKFAEENHALVYAFLHRKRLPEDIYYDIVIFGYLRAVQKYCDTPSLQEYRFSTIAWRQMRRSLYNYYRYLSRPKRNAPTVSLEEPVGPGHGLLREEIICCQDALMRGLEEELLLHSLASALPPREMRIVRMKARGDRMHDIAKAERLTFRQINQLLSDVYRTVETVFYQ